MSKRVPRAMRGGRLVVVWLVLPAAAAAFAQQARNPAAPAPTPSPRPRGAGIGIGTLSWLDRELERAELPAKTSWQHLREGDKIRTGDSFRTGADATARLEFPWMAVTLGGSSLLTIPASTVLSTVLEQGRAEFSGEGRDIVKIKVGDGDGEVRGGGRLVLRRSVGRTSVAVLAGSFRVRAARRTVEVKSGHGTVINDGRPPEAARPLPPPPGGLVPGKDPAYVRAGRPVELRWVAGPTPYHVELLALDRDHVLLARDVSTSPLRLELPWRGTYRWRVSARDGLGIESRPSSEGLICSVER